MGTDNEAIAGWLAGRYPEVGPRDFYRDLFPVGELEERGVHNRGEYHGVAVQIAGEGRARRYSVTDDLDVIDRLVATDDFCVMSPVSYAGKTQRQDMARFLYSVTFDLDGVILKRGGLDVYGLEALVHQTTGESAIDDGLPSYLPLPTYIVSSGSGCHLYYMLERPIPLFKNVIAQLQGLRRALTRRIWNGYVTTLVDNVQYESVTQGFRMVGTATKGGGRVRAFRTGARVTVEHLNLFVPERARVTRFSYKSELSLAEARERYPEWYQRRVVEGKAPGTWTCDRALYDWWRGRAGECAVGHRYFYVMALAIYARKCGIDQGELERDAYGTIGVLDRLSPPDGSNDFGADDVARALEAYDACYQTFPRAAIERMTALPMPVNKRRAKPLSREAHMRRVNQIIEMDVANGFAEDPRYRGGAPTKRDLVASYYAGHPGASHSRAARDLGLSRTTVIKWCRELAAEAGGGEDAAN